MRGKLDNVIAVVLIGCALITTGLVVHRYFFDASTRPVAQQPQRPVFFEHWRSYVVKGTQLGPSSAPVKLIEFADFECPYCASFHEDLKTLRNRYPTQVALYYVHYPLPMHRFAEPAARAAECAGEQRHFEAMHDLLFDHQNVIGLKPWSEFSIEAGVPSLPEFETCMKNTHPVPRIVEGLRLAEQLDIQGTPTLIINGWKLARPPSAEELDRMVRAVLSGKSPTSVVANSDSVADLK